MKAKLYGVSVGPGEAELLTLKAVRIIKACPVVAAPRTKTGQMLALEIVSQVLALELENKILLPLDLEMCADAKLRDVAHARAFLKVRDYLDSGQDIALLTLGDLSIYASFEYFARALAADYEIQRIPGVTSFCAAAAAAGTSLVLEGESLSISPHGKTATIPLKNTQIYMKTGKALKDLLKKLQKEARLEQSILVQNCGFENERIYQGSAIIPEKITLDYFSILITKES